MCGCTWQQQQKLDWRKITEKKTERNLWTEWNWMNEMNGGKSVKLKRQRLLLLLLLYKYYWK